MLTSRRLAALCAVACTLCLAGTARATVAGTNASVDPSTLALAPSDFPGSLTVFNGPLKASGISAYVTVLLPNGARSSSFVESVLTLQRDAATAAKALEGLTSLSHTRAGRLALGKQFAGSATAFAASPSVRKQLHITGKATVSSIAVGMPSSPSKDVLVLPISAKIAGSKLYLAIAYLQVDQAVEAVEIIRGNTPASRAALTPLIALARKRLDAGFTVANIAPPTIAGTATAGQTLAGDTGNWTGGASSLSYSWQRCAADGTACAPIAGATGPTYVVSSTDVGSTIRVAVTGSNTVSSAQATSAQTAVVA
jgi:hypothetical protein